MSAFIGADGIEGIPTLGTVRRRLRAASSKPRKRGQFIPKAWIDKLVFAKRASTMRLALYIIRLNYGSKGEPVTVSNKPLEAYNVTRREKPKALKELAGLGLIEVLASGRGCASRVICLPLSDTVGATIH